jgi:RNA polymerase sigma-70 factor (ECF subfamily)
LDQEEFSRRVLAARERLYRVAIAILSREADAEDAAQEALVKAWRALPGLREGKYFETWLIRILINECRRTRRSRAKASLGEFPEGLPAPEPPAPALRDALEMLDEKYRLPLVLHHAEGYTLSETARLLRLPEGAVKWRIRKGAAKLKDILTEGEVRL